MRVDGPDGRRVRAGPAAAELGHRDRPGRLVRAREHLRRGAEAGRGHPGRRRLEDADQRVLARARRGLSERGRGLWRHRRLSGGAERGRPARPALDRRDADLPGLRRAAVLAADRREPAAGNGDGEGGGHPGRQRQRRGDLDGRALRGQRPARQRRSRRPVVPRQCPGRRQGRGDRGSGGCLRRRPADGRVHRHDHRGRQVRGGRQRSGQLGPPGRL